MSAQSTRYRTRITQTLIVLIVWSCWLAAMNDQNRWHLFSENWYMSLTMMVGSFVAGATSEGGGAVAFPVMTLVFDIDPRVARDFSLMIQSVGMSAATVTILLFGIRVEWRALLFAGLGGAFGIIIGLEWIAPLLPAAYTKTFFLSLWLSFALALYWINRNREREVLIRINPFGPGQASVLIAVGLIGGIISGITGSGLDILTFSLLVLAFSLSEKVATPTSVILMANNALVGFAWQQFGAGGVAEQAWSFWWVCVPVVVIGAPLGARFIRDRSRHFVTCLLYGSIIIQYIGGLLIIPQTGPLLLFNAGVLCTGSLLFWRLARSGKARLGRLSPALSTGPVKS